MSRLFIGLEIPPPLAQSLSFSASGIPKARWQQPENLHLTLAFVGECDGRQQEQIINLLNQISFDAFELRLQSCGIFPPRGTPRSLWIGVEPNPRLEELHKTIHHALEAAGFNVDHRKFAPHITLARLDRRSYPKHLQAWVETHVAVVYPSFCVEDFYLYSSIRGPTGSKYRKEAGFRANRSEDGSFAEIRNRQSHEP